MASTAPFGIIVPGRPVLVQPTVISDTQYAFSFPLSAAFTHLVVFFLPGTSLPDGTLTGVYIQQDASATFQLLGAIGNDKPSAIFSVPTSTASQQNNAAAETGMMTDAGISAGAATNVSVSVGISIEPAATLASQVDALKSSTATPTTNGASSVTTKLLAQRIIKNAFNFLAGFAGTAGPNGVEVVPLKSFQDWWTKFERRVDNDPKFLERDAD